MTENPLRLQFPAPSQSLPFTGERYVSGLTGIIQHEHYHRYLFAARFCAGRDVLDVACGEGYGSHLLGQCAKSVIGVDISSEAVNFAEQAYKSETVSFRLGSATELPLPDACVDLVVSFETLEHLVDHERFLQEIKRVLRSDGVLLISTPNTKIYSIEANHNNPFHLRELEEAEFLALLRKHFSQVDLFQQRALSGSVILRQVGMTAPDDYLIEGWDSADGLAFQRENGVPAAPYLVAVAANGNVGAVTGSVLHTPSEIISHERAVAERDGRIDSLQEEVRRLAFSLQMERQGFESQIADMRHEVDASRGMAQRAQEGLAQVHERVARTEATLQQAWTRHDQLIHSLSWRLTSPLRWIYGGLIKAVPSILTARRKFTALASRVPGQYWFVTRRHRLQPAASKGIACLPDGLMSSQAEDSEITFVVADGATVQGWCALEVDVRSVSGPLQAVVYYKDREHDDLNVFGLPLPRLTVGKHSILIRLLSSVTDITLVFSARVGVAFRFGDLVVKELSKADLCFRLFKNLPAERKVKLIKALGKGNLRSAQDLFRSAVGVENAEYSRWIALYDRLGDENIRAIRDRLAVMPRRPCISIVMPVYNTPLVYLRSAIESVISQLYTDWELCISDDNSPNQQVRDLLRQYAAADPRIKVTFRPVNGHISASSNSALELVTGEFTVLMDHDDELPLHALYMVAEELNRHPDADIIYSDEDKIDADGARFNPYFKSDWNRELFYSQNFIAHMGVYRTELIRKAGGFRMGLEGSQDYDLVLRILPHTSDDRIRHIPHILYHWRVFPGGSTFSTDNPGRSIESARKALEDYFDVTNQTVEITAVTSFHWWRIKRPLPVPAPKISVIIPTRDRLNLLQNCVNGLLEKTEYDNLEIIIVDNASEESATLSYFRDLTAQQPNVKVMHIEGPFDFSLLNNQAAAAATGEFLLFLNNDVEVIEPNWLSELVSQCAQPGVGAVGAKLYYPNETVQHAGVVLGVYGVAAHSFRHHARNDVGYFGRLVLAQDVSAVTAACMLVPRSVFKEIGGYLEDGLAVGYGDVDLCLRIRSAGYRIIMTPFAELYHLESATRGDDLTPEQKARNLKERATMREIWGDLLNRDPFYNPNLSLKTEDYDLAFPPRTVKPWLDVEADGVQVKSTASSSAVTEFVCPFHRGDVLLGIQAAAMAVEDGVKIRFHVAESLCQWVKDFAPPFDVETIPIAVPKSEAQAGSLVIAHEYVAGRPDCSANLVMSHPTQSLVATNSTLMGHLLQQLGIPERPVRNVPPVVTNDQRAFVEARFARYQKPLVLLHPWGGWQLKNLPRNLISDLLPMLRDLGYIAVQIGGPSDTPIPGIDGLCLEAWTPSLWRVVFEYADAIIGVDSWSSHFASILDVPQITFYGSTNPRQVNSKRWFDSRESPSLVLGPKVPCSPCESLVCTVFGEPECRGFDLDRDAIKAFFETIRAKRPLAAE